MAVEKRVEAVDMIAKLISIRNKNNTDFLDQ